jgi:hypothetical protein
MLNPETPIKFSELPDNKFFILDGVTYCKFGPYGLGFHNGENVFKIVDPKILVEHVELKDIFDKKS